MATGRGKPAYDSFSGGGSSYGSRSRGWSSGRSWNSDSYGGYGNYGGYGGGYGFMYSNNIKASDFEKGTITAAKTLSNDKNIQVIFGGDEVKTTDDLIQLPSIDVITGISPSDAKVVRGYTDHEIIRRRVSSPTALEQFKKSNPHIHKMLECIEDVRTDKAGKTLYSGTGDNIEAAINKLADKMYEQMVANPKIAEDIEKIGPYAVAMEGRKQAGYDITKHEQIMDMLNPIDRALIEEISAKAVALDDGVGSFGDINRARATNGFYDSTKLATEANKLFALRATEKKEEEESRGSSPGFGDGKDAADGSGPPGVGTDEEGSEDLMLDMGQALKGVFKGPRTKTDPSRYLPGIRDMDVFWQPEDLLKGLAGQSSKNMTAVRDMGLLRANQKLRETTSGLAVMKTNLERMLMSKNIDTREEKRGGGKLNGRKLVQAYNRDENVFTKRADDVAINTAVQLVVDLSGSMHGTKLNLALQATILMSEALAKCSVPFEIVGFSTIGQGHLVRLPANKRKAIEDLQNTSKTNRYDGIRMTYFKPFADRYQMCLPAIGSMYANGANCDGESILYASESLLKRPERKKVMLILSDGEPAFGYKNCDSAAMHTYVKETAERISQQGVFVLGIGIQSSAVTHYYKNNIVIDKVEQLPKAILEQLAAAIL